MGVGGAFGAVGADVGCASINPAGLSRFRTSKFYITSAMANFKNNSNFDNSNLLKSEKFNFQLPNLAIVFHGRGIDYEERKPKGLVNYTFGYSMNRINSYVREINFENPNNNTSISQFWAEKGNGQYVHQLSLYTMERLAYDGLLIDVDTNSSTPKYASAYGNGTNLNMKQSGSLITKGSLNDHIFFISANLKHKFHFGLSLGLKQVNYHENFNFIESDNRNNNDKDISKITVNNFVNTKGLGFNAKIGIIYNITDFIRVGYAFHSPTKFNLVDSYQYTVRAEFDAGAKDPFNTSRFNNSKSTPNPLIKYNITTPMRQVFSTCFINKKIGFLSLDAELINFTKIKMNDSENSFGKENKSFTINYKPIINWRLGGEAIYENLRFRAGVSIIPSSFKPDYQSGFRREINASYHFGIGLKNKTSSFDIAFVHNRFKDEIRPYQLADGNNLLVKNLLISNTFVLTYSISFDIES